MAEKRYDMSAAALAATGMLSDSGATFKFKFRFDSAGTNTATAGCPLFSMPIADTVGTSNLTAQKYFDEALVPALWGGSGEKLWTDVTGSTAPGDVDLDVDASL